jgi:hypothetical protein
LFSRLDGARGSNEKKIVNRLPDLTPTKSSASSHTVHFIVPTHHRESLGESQSDNIGFGSVATLLKDYGEWFQRTIRVEWV